MERAYIFQTLRGSPLYYAILSGHHEVVRFFLRTKEAKKLVRMEGNDPANPNKVLMPIEAAVQYGHVEVLKELLKFGAHVKSKDSEKDTLLHIAARQGHDK